MLNSCSYFLSHFKCALTNYAVVSTFQKIMNGCLQLFLSKMKMKNVCLHKIPAAHGNPEKSWNWTKVAKGPGKSKISQWLFAL